MTVKGTNIISSILLLFVAYTVTAQQKYELNKGWKCKKANEVNKSGAEVSQYSFPLVKWMPAVVPGTVLTTLLYNKLIPDPFYGMNNKQIPDIYTAGRDKYTYWFVNEINEQPAGDEHVYITFRGVNYACDIFVNGRKVNTEQMEGMYLRGRFDITALLQRNGQNRIAVIVYPPDPVGNPNGGQGGDGTIARSLTNQYVAGWDWIQPVADRNTGIWDKVYIEKTGKVSMGNTHVVTSLPGKRANEVKVVPGKVSVTTEVTNADMQTAITAKVECAVAGKVLSIPVTLKAGEKKLVTLPDIMVDHPRLWWPNGYGRPDLYNMQLKVVTGSNIRSDDEQLWFGIRELGTAWNSQTQSRELYVNGQRIFLKGGNRIVSDALLRFSDERYDAEMRMHRDMNLNLIRVWGGGITERPEFYDACDKYGLLVMQDLWMTGDCNGRWHDATKLDDTTTRRNYPDNHHLFLNACADQIKMLRNHASLALWCGGNEIRPPADILKPMKDSLRVLDGTRYFFEYSNHDSMSLGAHDGPYTIQRNNYFWEHRSWGFNSEIGSVGIGDLESLERFIPKKGLVPPVYDTAAKKWVADSVWQYHKYSSYDSAIEQYGHPADIADFAKKAQLVNYEQYRSLMESFVAKMWQWYTGVIVWKTQNPWTAMVGQMYDVYLDPNASMYGLAEASKATHVMYDPVAHKVLIANTTAGIDSVRLEIKGLDMNGKERMAYSTAIARDSVHTGRAYACHDFKGKITDLAGNEGLLLWLRLSYKAGGVYNTDEQTYWIADRYGNYSGLSGMPKAAVKVKADLVIRGKVSVILTNPAGNTVAFFNRISLVDDKTKKRILPVFCNNNYISILPGGEQKVTLDYTAIEGVMPVVCVEGWNVDKQYVQIKK